MNLKFYFTKIKNDTGLEKEDENHITENYCCCYGRKDIYKDIDSCIH